MADEPTPASDSQPDADPAQTPIELAYDAPSGVDAEGDGVRLAFFGNLKRDPVRFAGRITDPLRVRDLLVSLHRIVGSDYRYVPRDRSRYIAWQRLKRDSSSLSAWQAQQAYFDWLSRNDPLAWLILDPVLTVHPDGVLLEVFSKDEGTYAAAHVSTDAFESDGDPTCGTTNVDFSEGLRDGLLELRSDRETTLRIGQEAVEVATSGAEGVVEKSIAVPDSWLRGFLQVQSAATLPCETVHLAPLDLYNALRHLRMNADQKGKRRGLKFELMPGQQARLVLEPWGTVIRSRGEAYTGLSSKVIRVWGRRRLMLVADLLPWVDSVEVRLTGSGLPSFWIFRMGPVSLTLGLTGFTAANWSQAVNLDLLLPRRPDVSKNLKQVIKYLSQEWFADRAAIRDATGLKGEALQETLQLGCQQGQLMFDPARDVYRLRPLTAEPLPLDRLEYRDDRQRQAHDLVERKSSVRIDNQNRIVGTGVELSGTVRVTEDRREYKPSFLLTEEGGVTRTECTCPLYRKQQMKHGPCAHLIALRLAWSNLQRDQETGAARETILTETRTFSKRTEQTEEVYFVTLDRDRVVIRWGPDEEHLRRQTLRFNSVEDARSAYLHRLSDLGRKGYLDATMT